MTSQPPGDKPASQFTMPLRELAALVLVGATAVLLFVALTGLFPRGGFPISYLQYASSRFGSFVNLATVTFPLVAVLMATHLEPKVDRAPLITVAALVELAVAAFFGLLFGTFLGFIGDVSHGSGRVALEGLLTRAAYLGVLGVVLYAVFRVWQGLYYVPRPKAAPNGIYGQPRPYGPRQGNDQPDHSQGYGQPSTHGQPGYAQQPGQPPRYAEAGPGAAQGYGPAAHAAPDTASRPPAPGSTPAPASTPPAPAGGPPDDPFRTQVIRPADDPPGGPGDQPTQRWER